MTVIIWILFCILVGSYAGTKGKSSVGYFFISLFLSPLVGFVIALCSRDDKDIDGNNIVKKECLDKVIYVCPKCGSTYMYKTGLRPRCRCGDSLRETEVLITHWRLYTEEEKNRVKREIMEVNS